MRYENVNVIKKESKMKVKSKNACHSDQTISQA